MSKKILIDAKYPKETRVAILDLDGNIQEIEYTTASVNQIKNNIYIAVVKRVEQALQAAFIDYGGNKHGFLPFSEIHPAYYRANNKPLSFKTLVHPKITDADLAEFESRPYTEPDNTIEDLEEEDKLDTAVEEAKSSTAITKNKIQDVISVGQVLLVQAEKEERGNKGASFSTYISVAGRYSVLMPNKPHQSGISRRINKTEERKRLRNIMSDLIHKDDEETASIIIRTGGISRTTYEMKKDYDFLVGLWNKILETCSKITTPSFIHADDDIVYKIVRDMCGHNISEICIQGADTHTKVLECMKYIAPSELSKIKEYTDHVPIFSAFNVENQFTALYKPIVGLASGGYIVINPTEALTSIDVNSGKAISGGNIEETAIQTNLEAAKEIAKQLRLRNIYGLIVIDFIDMYDAKNRKTVEKTFRTYLKIDKARIQFGSITPFGLLEMSRQRLRPSFLESNSTICTMCDGKGIVRTVETNASVILRTIENEISGDYQNIDVINVFVPINPLIYLLNNYKNEIIAIENTYSVKIYFHHDPEAIADSFSIEKTTLPKIEAKQENACLMYSYDAVELPPTKIKWQEEETLEPAQTIVNNKKKPYKGRRSRPAKKPPNNVV